MGLDKFDLVINERTETIYLVCNRRCASRWDLDVSGRTLDDIVHEAEQHINRAHGDDQ